MRVKIQKLKKFLPKRIQTKRAAYLASALLILFSLFAYDVFFRSPKVKAATIGTSSSFASTGNGVQRNMVVTENGVIVTFYNAGTQGATGIVYSTSSDNGTTWSSPSQVVATQSDDFSVTIDGSNNIYIAYSDATSSPSVYARKMTYSSGSWSIGAATTVAASTPCGNTSDNYNSPTIAVNSSGVVEVLVVDDVQNSFCTHASYSTSSFYSSNMTSWTQGTSLSGTGNPIPIVSNGKSFWTTPPSPLYIYADIAGNGTWANTNLSPACTVPPSMVYQFDKIFFACDDGPNGLDISSYNVTTGAINVEVTGAAGSNLSKVLTTDSNNVWLILQQYIGTNQYNIQYMRYNGSTWGSLTSLITDNLNNTHISTPARVPNTANVPFTWTAGTASPYTVKASAFSTVGTVTDSGNQSGSYTGTLTGSGGDTIVKCGTWYYDTVNIVAGMTVKVCSSNGQTGGKLIIYANTVTVAGTIDGAGRGAPGGASIYGAGGAGGASTGTGLSVVGNNGAAGSSVNGGTGTGSYGGAGGSKGTSATTGGSGGAGASAVAPVASAGGGGGGSGSVTTSGSSGSLGGYLGSGINGDTSTDESAPQGGGGGAGGSGGSGAGGGSGGGGTSSCGYGGAGGNGGNGGIGGKGGNAGAVVKIYSAGSLTVSGTINITGQAGTSGASGSGGSNGSGGGVSGNFC